MADVIFFDIFLAEVKSGFPIIDPEKREKPDRDEES
jgi:hypothetical protein